MIHKIHLSNKTTFSKINEIWILSAHSASLESFSQTKISVIGKNCGLIACNRKLVAWTQPPVGVLRQILVHNRNSASEKYKKACRQIIEIANIVNKKQRSLKLKCNQFNHHYRWNIRAGSPRGPVTIVDGELRRGPEDACYVLEDETVGRRGVRKFRWGTFGKPVFFYFILIYCLWLFIIIYFIIVNLFFVINIFLGLSGNALWLGPIKGTPWEKSSPKGEGGDSNHRRGGGEQNAKKYDNNDVPDQGVGQLGARCVVPQCLGPNYEIGSDPEEGCAENVFKKIKLMVSDK